MWTMSFAAHVSLVVDPVTVVHYNAQLFQHTSISLGMYVIMVSTSFGRDSWQRNRQERASVSLVS